MGRDEGSLVNDARRPNSLNLFLFNQRGKTKKKNCCIQYTANGALTRNNDSRADEGDSVLS
jgi:hypothetical protein